MRRTAFILSGGRTGEPGLPGAPGPMGEKGDKGDKGEKGDITWHKLNLICDKGDITWHKLNLICDKGAVEGSPPNEEVDYDYIERTVRPYILSDKLHHVQYRFHRDGNYTMIYIRYKIGSSDQWTHRVENYDQKLER